MKMANRILGLALVLALAGACSEPRAGAVSPGSSERDSDMDQAESGGGSAPQALPFAHGRTFASLDEYLEHLRLRAGPIGQPWYREIRPGVYEQVTTMRPAGEPETVTRAELMERYGFTR